jgi:molecular chaperone GrpE
MEENKEVTETIEEKVEEVTLEELSAEDKLKAEVNEYKDKWMRSVAEFDNYKKRNASVYRDAFVNGKSDTILKILPLGDNLELAIGMIPDEKSREGVVMLLKQFNEVLKNLGVEVIDPTGEEFNPEIAEAVMQVEGDENDKSGTVKNTFRKGYKADNKIIRYAQVSVVR